MTTPEAYSGGLQGSGEGGPDHGRGSTPPVLRSLLVDISHPCFCQASHSQTWCGGSGVVQPPATSLCWFYFNIPPGQLVLHLFPCLQYHIHILTLVYPSTLITTQPRQYFNITKLRIVWAVLNWYFLNMSLI